MNFGSLFSGIGGIDLGLERAGMKCKWQVEINSFCLKVLAKHWPTVPKLKDIKSIKGENLEYVDLICGGFPCQPFSSASHGHITAEDLWPNMFQIIKSIKPRFIIAENVQKKPITKAACQLKSIGYGTSITRLSASQFGAWHRRNRWFVVAYSNYNAKFQSELNAETQKLSRLANNFWKWSDYASRIRVVDGIPNRVDRLRSLGNAVPPQIAEEIGKAIIKLENYMPD